MANLEERFGRLEVRDTSQLYERLSIGISSDTIVRTANGFRNLHEVTIDVLDLYPPAADFAANCKRGLNLEPP